MSSNMSLNPASGIPSATSHNPRFSSRSASISFPFPFNWSSQANLSATSLVTSSAEGRAIPVDDTTAESRTSALRRFNEENPSRHRYSKSTGAQSKTFQEPIIVRTYAPQPKSAKPTTESGIIIVNKGPVPRPHRRPITFAGRAREGMLDSMARMTGRKRRDGSQDIPAPALPPVEAFTFKSFLENAADQTEGGGLNSDLDRIAEICARSRYSLSSQHDAHYGPHGTGDAFANPALLQKDGHGPTLQVVPVEDENSTRSRRRRHGVRRTSRAVGTLETIISGSRSSEEEHTPKKSAAELADGVRERTARDADGSVETAGPGDHSETQHGDSQPSGQRPATRTRRRASTSLALIDSARQSTSTSGSSPQTSRSDLVCEPSQPETCTSQLFTSTLEAVPPPHDVAVEDDAPMGRLQRKVLSHDHPNTAVSTTLGSWMPWASRGDVPRAEGKLKELLGHRQASRSKQ